MANEWGFNGNQSNISDIKVENKNGFQHNTNVPEPVVVNTNSTQFYTNNKNYDALTQEDYVSGIWLSMLEENPSQVYLQLGTHLTLPARKGTNSYRLNRMRDLGVVINPIREGQLPKKLNVSFEKVNVTTSEYGAYMEITDRERNMAPVELFAVYGQRLLKSAMKTMDIIAREVLFMGASKYYTGPKPTDKVALTNALTYDYLSMLVRQMEEDKVEKIGGTYKLILDRDGLMELQRDPWFIKYTANQTLAPIQSQPWDATITIGDISIIRISDNAKRVANPGANKEDLHVAFLIGKDGYAVVGMEGLSSGPRLIHKELGSAGTADPLNQLETLAYRIEAFGVAVLKGEAVAVIIYPGVRDAVMGAVPAAGEQMYADLTADTVNGKGSLIGNMDINMAEIWDANENPCSGVAVYPKPYMPHESWASAQKGAVSGISLNPVTEDPTYSTSEPNTKK
jgi:N4-gp56 family major capsid protein